MSEPFGERSLAARVEELEARVRSLFTLASETVSLREEVSNLKAQLDRKLDLSFETLLEREQFQSDTAEWLSALSSGADLRLLALPRYVSILAYLSDGSTRAVGDLQDAVPNILDEFDLEQGPGTIGKPGSWLQKFFGRTKEAMTSKEFQDRMSQLEQAVHLQAIGKPQAEIGLSQAEALAKLLEATKNDASAFFVFGSTAMIRFKDHLGASHTRSVPISAELLAEIERNPEGALELLIPGHLASLPPLSSETDHDNNTVELKYVDGSSRIKGLPKPGD